MEEMSCLFPLVWVSEKSVESPVLEQSFVRNGTGYDLEVGVGGRWSSCGGGHYDIRPTTVIMTKEGFG